MDLLDKAKTAREGEEIDPEAVARYLEKTVPGFIGPLTILQYPSGHSNLTYLLKAGEREMVLRRPPIGTKAKTAHDMGREFRILSALSPHFPCPRPLAYCEDPAVMGCPFYVMEKISGIILRKDFPPELGMTPDRVRKLCENLIALQAKLHMLPVEEMGLSDFGKPEGYVQRQVEGWSKRYRNARTEDAPDFEKIMQWLAASLPGGPARAAIIHGDYKFDNVILDPADPLKIIGVLDWEMATVGDPLMDLGSSLAYWVQADDPEEVQAVRMMPTDAPGALKRSEMVRLYEEITGTKIENFAFYHCFGLFRLAVIAQQIYYRFFHGQTKDPRFARLIFAVHILEQAADQVVRGA
ncbi:MAG: phosphotransferase family protein [Thermodesulfobacteriota bacterium]